jgi:predicted glycogen debranching enzyme
MKGQDKSMKFGKGYWKTFLAGVEREWVITNGLGSYCGSTIIGASARKHHGYLIASLHPPVERKVFINKSDEYITIDGKLYSFATNQRVGGWHDEGQVYLQQFIYDELPHFVYQAEGVFVTKTLSFEWEKNTVAVCYEILNGSQEAEFGIRPFITNRDHNESAGYLDLLFEEKQVDAHTYTLTPENRKDVTLTCYASEGVFKENEVKIDKNIVLQTEIVTGGDATETSYTPFDIMVTVKPYEQKKITVIYTIEDEFEKDGFLTMERAVERIQALKEKAGYEDAFASTLVQAADQFIVKRESTGNKTVMAGYPWFTDWGRDTMIALQGLTLSTKRFEDARSILKSFAMYVKNGLVPNVFPDGGTEPGYNTADASLWYFYSVDKYLEYTGNQEDYDFIQNEIYGKLEEIVHFYSTKTDFSIYMDEDKLVHAGGGYDQVTWMDVRVGTWVVTPRHGKPVEINALWYNALKVMEKLAARFGKTMTEYGKDSAWYGDLAAQVKTSFVEKFWNEKDRCLYDVVEEEGVDDKIRLNQIYAVSLPYTMLDAEKEKQVVECVMNRLYATYGLRTLNKEHVEYQPYYKGKLHDRDAAYHQGTAWAYPLGAFVTAYVKVFGKTEYAKAYVRKIIEPMADHLRDGCIGSIAEIFDGNEPNISRGTYAQAWSVGELLRAYTEDVL